MVYLNVEKIIYYFVPYSYTDDVLNGIDIDKDYVLTFNMTSQSQLHAT